MAKLHKTPAHKKVSSDDKMLFYYYKAVDLFEKYKKQAYIAGIAIVVIIAAIFIYSKKQSASNETAGLELSKVKQIYLSGSYDQAINGDSLGISRGLLFIVNEYGSSENGNAAKILLANSYYFKRDFANAEKYYRDFSGNSAFYKAAALAGIGAVYEANGKYNEAAKEFIKASEVSKDVPLNEEYLYSAARNLFEAKNADDLKKVIDKMKTDYPKSKFISMIERYNTLSNK
jgi:tetratricopeptide (TPR) repeat protein